MYVHFTVKKFLSTQRNSSFLANYRLPLSIHSHQGGDKPAKRHQNTAVRYLQCYEPQNTQRPFVYADKFSACCWDPYIQHVNYELLLSCGSSTAGESAESV